MVSGSSTTPSPANRSQRFPKRLSPGRLVRAGTGTRPNAARQNPPRPLRLSIKLGLPGRCGQQPAATSLPQRSLVWDARVVNRLGLQNRAARGQASVPWGHRPRTPPESQRSSMASEKSLALVIRVVDFSETSCVVTLFSEQFGKISALAKGARRTKSPFESALDLLSLCRIVFVHKSSDALHLLTEAKLERRFRAAAHDLSRLYAGYYVAELLRALTDEGDPHPELFQVANVVLAGLDEDAEWRSDLFRFELTALRLLGHLPMLESCVGCGQHIEITNRVAFGQLAGGVLCSNCRIGQRQVVSVSGEVIATMRRYTEENQSPRQTVPMTRQVAGELRGVLSRYMCHLLGHRPRMHQWLDG